MPVRPVQTTLGLTALLLLALLAALKVLFPAPEVLRRLALGPQNTPEGMVGATPVDTGEAVVVAVVAQTERALLVALMNQCLPVTAQAAVVARVADQLAK